jgi:hypothetical protein
VLGQHDTPLISANLRGLVRLRRTALPRRGDEIIHETIGNLVARGQLHRLHVGDCDRPRL